VSSGFGQSGQETEASAIPRERAPADDRDPVIEVYKQGVDRTLLRENLKLTVEERFVKFERFWEYSQELRRAGRQGRQTQSGSGHGTQLPRDSANARSE
jgi:hypothetical protein